MSEQRLIDANALDKIVAEEAVFKIKQADRDSSRAEARGLIQTRQYIKEAPTIPAEIVTHCGECDFLQHTGDSPAFCPILNTYPMDGFYCGAGKRKDDSHDTKA